MKRKLLIAGSVLIMFLLSASQLFSAESGTGKNEKIKKSGWIGIMIQDVSEKAAQKAKLDSDEGAYVSDVLDDSPADSAGLKKGDICIEFNGKKLLDADDLSKAVEKTSPGTKVNIVVIRKREKKTIQLVVGARKEMRRHEFHVMPAVPDIRVHLGNNLLGMDLLPLNDQLGEYFGAPNNEGVLITEVEKESPGDKAGCKAGDIILRVGKRMVKKVENIQKELEKYDEGDKVEIEVLRKGVKKVLPVEMEDEQSIQKNFFFRAPRMHMFHSNPFDDADMRLEMEELQPGLDRMQRELDQTVKGLEHMQVEVEGQPDCLALVLHGTI